MAAQLLELEGEHVGVVLSATPGGLEGRGVGWKCGAAGKDAMSEGVNARGGMARAGRGDADNGLFEVCEAPADEGNDVLAHMLREDLLHELSSHMHASILYEDFVEYLHAPFNALHISCSCRID
ncbi:hypothetical protein BJV74DRAFT_954010 [Russula compacta]|nr:hypothetical protein BJV74DRAFT_954010 [Russula compacta]